MIKITEADLGYVNNNDENVMELDKKIILNKINKSIYHNDMSLSVKDSSSDDINSSKICKGCSSSSNIVSNGCECKVDIDGMRSLTVVEEGVSKSESVSQYIESSIPKQDANQPEIAGVSVALVTITEKIMDLPESKIVLDQLRERLKQDNIGMSQQNLMVILKITMELIEKSPLKGLSQKEVAIQILNKLLLEANLDNESVQVMSSFLDTNLIGDTIDLIISATKGEFDINKATKVATGCFTRIFGCFKLLSRKLKCNRRQKNMNVNLKEIQTHIKTDIEKDIQIDVQSQIEDINNNNINKIKNNENIKVQVLNEILT